MKVKRYIEFIIEESGIKNSEIASIVEKLEEYLSTLKPNFELKEPINCQVCGGEGIDQFHYSYCSNCNGDGKTDKVNFTVRIFANDSKYGKQIQIILICPGGRFGDLNLDFKQYNFVLELKSAIEYYMGGSAIFSGYDYCGKKLMGSKDGRTKTIEDVGEKFLSDVKLVNDDYFISNLSFYFTVQGLDKE